MHTRRIVLNVAARDSRAEQGQIRDVAGQVRHAIFFICIHTEAGAGAVASPALGRIKAVRYVCVCDLWDVPFCAHSHKKDGVGKSNRQRGERDT
jgi:hypothetical protein